MLNFLCNDSTAQSEVNINLLSSKESKIEVLENELNKLWSNFEYATRKKLTNYDKMFAADSITSEKSSNNTSATHDDQEKGKQLKRLHLCGYLILSDNEPFITNCLLNNLRESYTLTSGDLISVAKNGTSELTLHNLISNLEFNSENEINLLEPLDDLYGNFVEILFCRLVRCNNIEQESRLRRLFFEAVILKSAKMTCSTNLLNLFLSNSHHVKQKLLDAYFPCLFYLSNSFDLFKNEIHSKRFQLLTKWFAKMCMCISDDHAAIDVILFEFYANRLRVKVSQTALFNVTFEMRLKELARNSFAKVYRKHARAYNPFLNAISDSLRHFILYGNEIKSLF